jgi:tetratricopeptide (TPR) repeat protein
MDKVSLRVYNREIETVIEGGQFDEAVAHCQHILKTFPMHIETYRLLGKAFLEARRYADAADIFQRVLMAVPDDFVSQVGMSIIRDDEGKLNDAIWHMERAFEVQPSNSAIQGELRHLYGRRDGVEPSKIRLSRDALANMYAQGELFSQAIAEIRSVLSEDPNRPDLQVMLMRAYYRSGQKVEAAEMADALLKKYPYCLDALRVLVDILPETTRAENLQIYRDRLLLLDPYSSFTSDSVFSSSLVVDTAVELERLVYQSGTMPVSSRPDWASLLGIKLNSEKRAEPLPDWIQTPETGESSIASILESSGTGTAPATDTAAESVPEWKRSTSLQASTNAPQDGSVDTGEVLPEEPTVTPNIPDWLISMAPPEIIEESSIEPEEPAGALLESGDGIPDWLKPTAPTEVTGEAHLESQVPAEPKMASGESVTDLLTSRAPAEVTGEEPIEPQMPGEPEPASVDEIPDWLKSTVPAEATGISNIVPESTFPEVPALESAPEPEAAEAPSAEEGAFPDWLTGLGARAGAAAASFDEAREQPAVSDKPISEEPVLPDLVPSEPISPEPVSPEPVLPELVLPEPVLPESVLSEPVPPEPVTQEPADPLISASGTVVESFRPTGEVKPVNIGDDTLGWLESLAAKQGAKPEELLTNPHDRSSEMPEWLNQPGEQAAEAPVPPTQKPVSTPDEILPLKPSDLSAETSASTPGQPSEETLPVQEEVLSSERSVEATAQPAVQPISGEEDTMAWLDHLSADEGTEVEEPLVSPEGSLEATLGWIQNKPDDQPVIPAPEELAPASPESTAEEEDITNKSWLNKEEVEEVLGKTTTELHGDVPTIPPAEELPDWLNDIEKPSASVEAPKAGEDLPEWLRTPTSLVGSESTPEPEVPTWVDENVPVDGQAVPTMPEEWIPAESKPESGYEPAKTTESISAVEIPPVTEPGATSESTPVAESTPAVKAIPIAGPELTEGTPTNIEPAQVLESEPAVESPVIAEPTLAVESAMAEEVPAVHEPTQISEFEPAVESPVIAESTPAVLRAIVEEVPAVIEPTQVSESESAVESPADSGPTLAVEPVSISDIESPQLPTSKQSGMLSEIPALDKDAAQLSSAQTVLGKSSLDEAMNQYTTLIRKGRLLPEVIHDLREAIDRFPMDVNVWQTLGDAYMRANRLQDALDAYTKAEELLR